jgi:hypothetical protein
MRAGLGCFVYSLLDIVPYLKVPLLNTILYQSGVVPLPSLMMSAPKRQVTRHSADSLHG